MQLMNDMILKLYVKALDVRQALVTEDGQDLIEYAIVAALISFGALTASKTLANSIGTGFNNIGTKMTTYTA